MSASGTLMVKGDLKGMNARYLRGVSIVGYGCSLAVGMGIPIPILDEEMAWFTGVADEDIHVPVVDYGEDYPNGYPSKYGHVTFAELKSGVISVEGKDVPTTPLTSYTLSLEVAEELKRWILEGRFLLTEAQEPIPSR